MDLADLTKWERVVGFLLDKVEECTKRNSLGEAREWAHILSLVSHSEKMRS
jgi:hypothetical protein